MKKDELRQSGRTRTMLIAALRRAREGNHVVVIARKGELRELFSMALSCLKKPASSKYVDDFVSANGSKNTIILKKGTLTVHSAGSCGVFDSSNLTAYGISEKDTFIDHAAIEDLFGFVVNKYLLYIDLERIL